MARKKTTKAPEDMTATANAEAIEKSTKAQDELNKHLVVIDAEFGDGQPYDPYRLINEIRFIGKQAAEGLLEMGKRLILLKEHEQHGRFLEALEQADVHPRAAQRMMQAAIKFTGSKASLASHLGTSKLLELMAEEDDELEALAEGGSLAGHTLDEIERMTRDDLRAALRKTREDLKKDQEVHEKMIAAKDDKINDLDRKLHRLDNFPPDERADDLSHRMEREAYRLISGQLGLEVLIQEVSEWDGAPQHLKNLCQQSVNRIHTALDELRARWALTEMALEPGDDDWMKPFQDEQQRA